MFHSLLTTDVFVVVLGDAKASSESMLALGQSGFIELGTSGLDAHFMHQVRHFQDPRLQADAPVHKRAARGVTT